MKRQPSDSLSQSEPPRPTGGGTTNQPRPKDGRTDGGNREGASQGEAQQSSVVAVAVGVRVREEGSGEHRNDKRVQCSGNDNSSGKNYARCECV